MIGERRRAGRGARRQGPEREASVRTPASGSNGQIGAIVEDFMYSLVGIRLMTYEQLVPHRWSNQFNPMIWCAATGASYNHIRAQMQRGGYGVRALDAIRAWWTRQGVDEPGAALSALRGVSVRLRATPPVGAYAYIGPEVQEHVMQESGAEPHNLADLWRPPSDGPDGDDPGDRRPV